VIATLCDHAQGNLRALMIMAGELLEVAAQRDARQIDETLFFETCGDEIGYLSVGASAPAICSSNWSTPATRRAP
jgi:hypothetical protein